MAATIETVGNVGQEASPVRQRSLLTLNVAVWYVFEGWRWQFVTALRWELFKNGAKGWTHSWVLCWYVLHRNVANRAESVTDVSVSSWKSVV